jgi:hypothetical protein
MAKPVSVSDWTTEDLEKAYVGLMDKPDSPEKDQAILFLKLELSRRYRNVTRDRYRRYRHLASLAKKRPDVG